MTDTGPRGRVRSLSRPREDNVHRVNGTFYGHPGRVSYVPPADADKDVGDLRVARITAQVPFFQQLSPFAEWFPPTKTGAPGPDLKTSHSNRSQRLWLLRSNPEAFLGNADLGHLVSESLLAAPRQEPSAPSLLDAGEITNLSSTHAVTGCHAVALAAGEGGHILRLATLQDEDWGWAVDPGSKLRLKTATKSSDHGFWCGDGSPILKIKFAPRPRKHEQIRWLIVQKAASTTVLEPELRIEPVHDAESRCYLDLGKPSFIAANPLVTITKGATGGDLHCDFSFSPGFGNDPPQLAVVDRSGRWTVLDLMRERFAASRIARPTIKYTGQTSPAPMKGPSLSQAQDREWYRIHWVFENGSEDWGAMGGLSNDGLGIAGLFSGLDIPPRSAGKILVSSRTHVYLVEVQSRNVLSALCLVKQNAGDQILDVHVSPRHPSHAFVLTRTNLFWLELLPSPASKGAQPTILASCPHLRERSNRALKILVTGDPSQSGKEAVIVCLYSPRGQQMTVFWCSLDASGEQPQIHQQTARIVQADHGTRPDASGPECLLPLPTRLTNKSDGHSAGSAPVDVQNDSEFCQLLALGSDLRLSSFLGAVSRGRIPGIIAPDVRFDRLWRQGRRRAYLRRVEDSFVLPDGPGRDAARGPQLPSNVGSSRLIRVANQDSKTTNFRHFFTRVLEGMNRDISDGRDVADRSGETAPVVPFESIHGALQTAMDGSSPAFISLLDFMHGTEGPLEFEALSSELDTRVAEVQANNVGRVRIVHHRADNMQLSPGDAFERFSILWSATLSPNATRWMSERRMQLVLQRLALETTVAGLGVMVDRPVAVLDDEELPDSEAVVKREETPLAEETSLRAALPTPSASPFSEPIEYLPGERADEPGEQDPTAQRLQMYMSMKPLPRQNMPGLRLLSHWPEQPGSDPAGDSFIPGAVKGERGRGRSSRKKQRDTSKRRRSSEMPSMRGSSPAGPSTQPLPRIIHSSQAAPDDDSQGRSQLPSSYPLHPMSQPVPGIHGIRLGAPAKKKKSKAKGRKSIGGFR